MTERNDGIIISGGAVNVGGGMAAGQGARVDAVVSQPTLSAGPLEDPAVARKVEELETALRTHATQLADKEQAIAQLRELIDELGTPEPRGARVTDILGRLRDSIGSVASVMGSVASLEHVLTVLL
jgi:hypothetical protein